MSTAKDFVIPAAGQGLRLGLGIPKALLEIDGKSIVQRQIEMILRVSPESDIVLVTGFRHQELEALALRVNPNIRIVRNDVYETTGTSHSLRLAGPLVRDLCVLLPGDVLPNEHDLAKFLEGEDECIGLTAERTDSPVGVVLDSSGWVVKMDFGISGDYEWSGLAKIDGPRLPTFGSGHVFKSLQQRLPLRHKIVRALEVDTIEDLNYAQSNLEMIYGV